MGHLRGSLKHLSMDWSRGYFSALKKAPTVCPKVRGYDLWGAFFWRSLEVEFSLVCILQGPG